MKETVDINERLYNQITDYCNTNGIDISDYLYNLIEKGFFIDKYGDLNVIRNEVLNIDVSPIEVKDARLITKDTILLTTMSNNEITIKCHSLIKDESSEINIKIKTDNQEKNIKEKKVIVKRKIESK